MQKKLRTTIFGILAFIFLVAAPMILFYSEGYRYDFQQNKILKTGGFYVKTSIPAAEVYIDQKYINKTSQFINFDFLAQNLLPKNHDIRIQKTGYHTWEKNLMVKEKMVAQANITLFPDPIAFTPLEQNVKDIHTFPDQNILVLEDASGALYGYESQQKTLILTSKLAATIKISDIKMSPDGKMIIIKAIEKKSQKLKYYLVSTVKESIFLSEIKNLDKTTKNIFFYANNLIYFDLGSKIYKQTLDLQKPTIVINSPVDAFGLEGDNLYYLQNGNLIRENLLTTFKETLTVNFFETDSKSSYDLFIYSGKVFVLENKKIIYYLDDADDVLKKLINSDTEIKYYPQSDKVLFSDGSQLWLFFLNDYESPFFVKADAIIPLIKFNRAEDINWIGGDYFSFIDSKDKVEISEIDNRGNSVNFFEAFGSTTSQLWFNKNEKSLYVLSENILYFSPKIIP
jgi:hypothetical protein